jgi:hypothetical protein
MGAGAFWEVGPHAVYRDGALRVSRDGASVVGRGYLETGYANALRIGKQ